MKKFLVNYYAVIMMALFIIYNLIFKNLKIGGMLYQIFMIILIIVNIIVLIIFRRNIKNKSLVILVYEITKTGKYNFHFKLTIFFYILSILTFLFYLRFEYDPHIEINYFIRLLIVIVASAFVIIGNINYGDNYVEKLEDKKKVSKLSHIIVFILFYYLM